MTSTANALAFGSNSCISSTRFGATYTFNDVMPVTLPSGRLRLFTSPAATGSTPVSKIIGIVLVAALAAIAEALLPGVAITATWRRTRSAASAGNRSFWPLAQRYSILTLRPSSKPIALRPCWNAVTRIPNFSGVSLPKYPTTGIAGCCARAASGQATAAPPITLINSRRLMCPPKGHVVCGLKAAFARPPMSALGQKQTYAVQKAFMSAKCQ